MISRDVPPTGCGGRGCAPPTFRKFSVFPSKNAVFYFKKGRQIEKIGIAPPTFEKIVYGPFEHAKISFAAHPCLILSSDNFKYIRRVPMSLKSFRFGRSIAIVQNIND